MGHPILEVLGRILHLVHVIDHPGREENQELGAALGVALIAEYSADVGESGQERDAGRSNAVLVLDDAADRDGVPVGDRDLRAHGSLAERRRLDGRAGCRRDGLAELLVDHHRDDPARVDSRHQTERDSRVLLTDSVGEKRVPSLLDPRDGLRLEGWHFHADVDGGRDAVGGDDAG